MMRRILILTVLLASIGMAYAKLSVNHPRHQVIVWTTRFEGTIFRVIKFPHCEHVETVITHNPEEESVRGAKKRLGGFAASTACFYNQHTLLPVDFFRRNGKITVGREVGRKVLTISNDGKLNILSNYKQVLSCPENDAVALGSLIKPLSLDGFGLGFANAVTDRMALAISPQYIYIVQPRTTLWKISQFVEKRLPCDTAINTDGGHSVKGKSPFHIVFRWRKPNK